MTKITHIPNTNCSKFSAQISRGFSESIAFIFYRGQKLRIIVLIKFQALFSLLWCFSEHQCSNHLVFYLEGLFILVNSPLKPTFEIFGPVMWLRWVIQSDQFQSTLSHFKTKVTLIKFKAYDIQCKNPLSTKFSLWGEDVISYLALIFYKVKCQIEEVCFVLFWWVKQKKM